MAAQCLMQASTPSGVEDLRFDTTVPRRLVHRATVADVFVTDARKVAAGHYRVATQLPSAHALHGDSPLPYYDLLLGCEAARQATAYISHRWEGVPEDHAFIFGALDTRVDEVASLRIGPAPAQLVFDMRVTEQRHRRGTLSAQTMSVEGRLDGRISCVGEASARYMPAERYRALRALGHPGRSAQALPAPAAARPEIVGRHDPRNVVIASPVADGAGAVAAEIVVDEAHPGFFDQPLDHIPATLLLEAGRQTAIVATATATGAPPHALLLSACRARFEQFAELDLPATCRARSCADPTDTDVTRVELEIAQNGTRCCSAELAVRWCR